MGSRLVQRRVEIIRLSLPTCINDVFPLPAIPMQRMTVGTLSSLPELDGPASAAIAHLKV
jgi:hypothetical protein